MPSLGIDDLTWQRWQASGSSLPTVSWGDPEERNLKWEIFGRGLRIDVSPRQIPVRIHRGASDSHSVEHRKAPAVVRKTMSVNSTAAVSKASARKARSRGRVHAVPKQILAQIRAERAGLEALTQYQCRPCYAVPPSTRKGVGTWSDCATASHPSGRSPLSGRRCFQCCRLIVASSSLRLLMASGLPR